VGTEVFWNGDSRRKNRPSQGYTFLATLSADVRAINA
jgi:hypothetical protein